MWSVPGGRVEAGETLAEAVVRELAEETGLEAVCDELVGWVERIGDGYHYVILDFRVTVLDQAEPVAGDDAAEAALGQPRRTSPTWRWSRAWPSSCTTTASST